MSAENLILSLSKDEVFGGAELQLSPEPGSVRVFGERLLSAAPLGSVAGLGGWPSGEAVFWFSCSTS